MRGISTRWWAVSFAFVGLVLAGSAGWHLVILASPTTPVLHQIIDILLVGGAGIGFLYGGYWHATRPFTPEHYPRIVAWIVGSTLLFASLTVISLYIGSEQVTSPELLEALHPIGSIGLLVGLLVGTIHAQAITSAEAAVRAEVEAAALQAERERMEQLNDLLRHYILNGVTIIIGHANHVRGAIPAEQQSKLDTISDRAESMATLIKHFRVIPDGEQPATNRTALASLITSATTDLHPDVDVTVETLDTTLAVEANDVVKNALVLLCDAIVTITEQGGTLAFTCDHSEQSVTVTVTAEPASLPQSVADSLFEPIGAGISLKFYLAKQLLGDYGDLRLRDCTGQTVRFDITLDVAPEA